MRRPAVVLNRHAKHGVAAGPARHPAYPVIPAHAGIHCPSPPSVVDPGLRRDDGCMREHPTSSSGEGRH